MNGARDISGTHEQNVVEMFRLLQVWVCRYELEHLLIPQALLIVLLVAYILLCTL